MLAGVEDLIVKMQFVLLIIKGYIMVTSWHGYHGYHAMVTIVTSRTIVRNILNNSMFGKF